MTKNSNIASPKLLPNGEISSEASQESSSSSSLQTVSNAVSFFSPTIDGSARTASTGNDVRDRCQELIMKALKKGFNDGRHDNASSIGGFEGGQGGAFPPQVVVLKVKHTMSMCSALPACAALCQPVQR